MLEGQTIVGGLTSWPFGAGLLGGRPASAAGLPATERVARTIAAAIDRGDENVFMLRSSVDRGDASSGSMSPLATQSRTELGIRARKPARLRRSTLPCRDRPPTTMSAVR